MTIIVALLVTALREEMVLPEKATALIREDAA